MGRSFFIELVKPLLALLFWMLLPQIAAGQGPYIGTSLGFADYLEERCGIVFMEEGEPADPFQSMARHGATMVRIHVGHPPFSSSYSEGEPVDHHSVEMAERSLVRAKEAGLKTLLTFTYQSFALEDEEQLNIYVAPLAWQPVASETDRMVDSVYRFTYDVLDRYCGGGLIPEIVSIGQESTWHRLMPNLPEEELPPYDPARSVAIHNAGSRAVREIANKYDTTIKVCFHMRGPTVTKWWLEEHWPYGPDMDMIGISLYYGWNFDDYAGYESLGAYIRAIRETYGLEFIVMETAQMFTTGGSDTRVDILGTELIPPGYSNPPIPETQREYLADLSREVIENGGSGVLVWGGDWVASDCYIYADRWGKGSSWENKAFWDFDYNLHDGVNWMMKSKGRVPVTYKVDMEGADTASGVFLTGDFENFHGEKWAVNRMEPETGNIYTCTVFLEPGTGGAYYFLNDTFSTSREEVPEACAGDTGDTRIYFIPEDSEGEILAFKWSGCEPVPQFRLQTGIDGKGFTSPVSGYFSNGALIEVTATPAPGQRFTGWTGDVVSGDQILTLVMDEDRDVTAHFETIPAAEVRFEVDMAGADASKGVFVTGDFPNMAGKSWQLNRMGYEGGTLYSYSTWIPLGSSGAYYFMNDDQWGERETVPAACAEYWGSDRGYHIPENSGGETFAFVWSSCDSITFSSVYSTPFHREGILFLVYPNPAGQESFGIEFMVNDNVTLRIRDVTGRLVLQEEFETSEDEARSISLDHIFHGPCLVQCYFHGLNKQETHLLIFP